MSQDHDDDLGRSTEGDGIAAGPFVGAELVAVLPSADLDRAEQWYGRLGFSVVASYPGYRILEAGSVHLHLRHQHDADPTRSEAGVYLYLSGPDVLQQVQAGWAAAGARIIAAPEAQPYGLIEFATEDLDGNLWRVGAPIEPIDTSTDPVGSSDLSDLAAGDRVGPAEPEPDWFAVVVAGHCDDCGYTPSDGPASSVGSRIRDEAYRWTTLLRPADDDLVRRRPTAHVWSALEYGAHVRDVLAVFSDRVLRMLAETEPELGWWDHEAAIEDGFANESDREAVADDLMANADRLAVVLGDISGDQWERGGTRRDGERFTIELLVRFALHEVAHHRMDAERSLSPASG